MAEVVSLREVAKRCRVPMCWVEAEVKTGRLPFLRAGKKLLFNPAAVVEELARRAAERPQAVDKPPEPARVG